MLKQFNLHIDSDTSPILIEKFGRLVDKVENYEYDIIENKNMRSLSNIS